MAGELEGGKALGGLLSGLAQNTFHGHAGITEELLRVQLYPDVPADEFRPFLEKMRAILKTEWACQGLQPLQTNSRHLRHLCIWLRERQIQEGVENGHARAVDT